MQRLVGRAAIVTGGASGIGASIARKLAAEGASVLVADLDLPTAEHTVAEIRAAGGTGEALQTDVGRREDIRAMVERAVALWGRLDILVNNAFSVFSEGDGSAEEVAEETWDRWMAIIVKAVFLGCKHALPEMRKLGRGSVVNISSVHGLLGAERRLVYEAAKGAVLQATRQLACDYGPAGIRVNAICPGNIVTPAVYERYWRHNPEGRKLLEQQAPLRRDGRPEDVADAVVFLCSDEAAFITGHALVVDGGLTIQVQEDMALRQARYSSAHPNTVIPDTY
jgi:NAD(P)-dependent dehydrogenase (short-subunit alcohol dehydrogenase family)